MYKAIEIVWVAIFHIGLAFLAWYNVKIAVICVIAFSAIIYMTKEISAILKKRALKKAEKIVMKHEAMKRYKSGIGANIQ